MGESARKFRICRHSEARTGGGQLIEFVCESGDEEWVKEALQMIRSISLPTTRAVNVEHGGYGSYSRFQITQHEYAGGGYPGNGGFVEVLEIKDPPDGRHGVVLYEDSSHRGRIFFEFDTVKHAKAAFKKYYSCTDKLKDADTEDVKGLLRTVECGMLVPWFYAIGDEELVGDHAFPHGLQDDPVYRFGHTFAVKVLTEAGQEVWVPKVCMGTRLLKHTDPYSSRSGYYRRVAWDDGTVWDESVDDMLPRPLGNNELWAAEAMREFQSVLNGMQKRFTINFTDGRRFTGGLREPTKNQSMPEGRYWLLVSFEDGSTEEGWTDFTPTSEFPNVIALATEKFKQKGKVVTSVEITNRVPRPRGKKWAGAYYKPPAHET